MIKVPLLESNTETKTFRQFIPGTKYILSEQIPLNGTGTELIPISLGGRLVNSSNASTSVHELGKQVLKAAAEGDANEIRQLLSQGAPFTADWLGTSPLHLAAQSNHIEVCQVLLRAGISKDVRTKVDRTPLHMAAFEGHAEIVELLVKSGADIDCTDLLGMTPLHWAAQNGHTNVVTILVRQGASTNLINKFSLTSSDIAKQINRHDIVEIIMVGEIDTTEATQNLALEMNRDSQVDDNLDLHSSSSLNKSSQSDVEEIMEEEIPETETVEEEIHEDHSQEQTFSESIKLLQEHGITMLPHDDDGNILSSVMESGHSVVLTDVGKEVLNSVKVLEQQNEQLKSPNLKFENRNFITITPDKSFTFSSPVYTFNKSNILKQVNGKLVPKTVKRIVMRKNKTIPVASVSNIQKTKALCQFTDMETVMMQLIEARKTIEEYKVKLSLKEEEAERYKQQLQMLMDSN